MTVRGGIGGEEGIKTREIARFFKFSNTHKKKVCFDTALVTTLIYIQYITRAA